MIYFALFVGLFGVFAGLAVQIWTMLTRRETLINSTRNVAEKRETMRQRQRELIVSSILNVKPSEDEN